MENSVVHPFGSNGVHESHFLNVHKNSFDTPKVEDVDNFRSKRRPRRWQNVTHYFSQFCEATTIHGVRYIGERGRFKIEKLSWAVVVLIVCCLCISLICKAYSKWVMSPVIVTFATTETSISKIPFPAITICPEVKCDPEVFNYSLVMLKKSIDFELTEEEAYRFEVLSLVCTGIGRMMLKGVHKKSFNRTVGDDALNILWEIQPESLCASFNMLEMDEILVDAEEYVSKGSLQDTKPESWSLEDGYTNDNNMEAFPRRTFISGLAGGFVYEMFTNHTQLDYICGESLQGFKVTLHHPSELPDMDKYFLVPLDQAVYVGIKPRMITVSETLRYYEPEVRKCYFSHEKKLKYFRSYTQKSCLQECFSNYTIVECGCVAFYLPKDDDVPICGAESLECLTKSKVSYLSEQNDLSKTNKVTPCVCLPSCTSLEYDVEISQSDWNWRAAFNFFNNLDVKNWTFDYERSHVSKLVVFYKEIQFLSVERNELYGSVDFFASTGGLLGLFIGFSVTSLIEILYFLTL